MIVKKKIWPEFYDLIKSGKKKFELRVADFDVKEGNTLVLEEWDPKMKLHPQYLLRAGGAEISRSPAERGEGGQKPTPADKLPKKSAIF